MEIEYEKHHKEILDALKLLLEKDNERKDNFWQRSAEKILAGVGTVVLIALIGAIFTFRDVANKVENLDKEYSKKSDVIAIEERVKKVEETLIQKEKMETLKDDLNYNFGRLNQKLDMNLKTLK